MTIWFKVGLRCGRCASCLPDLEVISLVVFSLKTICIVTPRVSIIVRNQTWLIASFQTRNDSDLDVVSCIVSGYLSWLTKEVSMRLKGGLQCALDPDALVLKGAKILRNVLDHWHTQAQFLRKSLARQVAKLIDRPLGGPSHLEDA